MSLLVGVNAYVSKDLMDSATSGNRDRLIKVSIAVLALIVFQLGLRLIQSLVDSKLRIDMEADFRNYFVRNLFDKDYLKITSYHSGDLMTRMTNDTNCIIDGLVSIIPGAVGLVLRIVVAFLALFCSINSLRLSFLLSVFLFRWVPAL